MMYVVDKNLTAKIAEVEGGDYVRDMCINGEAADAIARVPALAAYLSLLSKRDPEDDSESTGIVIYGLGGWHRYYVRASGEVQFSIRHSHAAGQARAVAAGFTLA